jgi:zinc transport system substrate-binding protein
VLSHSKGEVGGIDNRFHVHYGWAVLAKLSLAVVVAVAAACGPSGASSDGRPRIVASFYPLAFVAERIAGDRARIVNLTPPGAEPHDIEPTSEQVIEISEADLILYLGGGFQPAIEELAADSGDAALDVAEGQDVLPPHGEEEAFDPHLWLDPTRMTAIAEATAERLAVIDPSGAGDLRAAARALVADLRTLDSDFENGLADCATRVIVTSHEAFGYLAARYGLEQIGIAGLDPEAEPSPQRLAEVADFVEEHDVTTIFFESLVSPEVAETIAEETGTTTAQLDPLEGPPKEGDYFDAMRANLDALRKALRCE